jgi:hypothetical protein
VTRAVDEEEVREHTPNNEADDDSTPSFSNGNKASEECTNWDERQAKDQSEMFHKTLCLSPITYPTYVSIMIYADLLAFSNSDICCQDRVSQW